MHDDLTASMRDPHWAVRHAVAAQSASAAGRLASAELRLLDRWFRYTRGLPGAPDVGQFVAFGRLATLERLRGALALVAPEQVGPIRLALRQRRREKRAGQCVRTGRQRGPVPEHSVPLEALPAGWRQALNDMRARRRRLDAGFLYLDERRPPPLERIRRIEYVLRNLAHVCQARGEPIRLDVAPVAVWLDDCATRGRRPTGLSAQIGQIQTFLRWIEPKSDLLKPLRRLRGRYAALGKLQRKKKESWLLANDLSLGDVWDKAEALLEAGRRLPPASRARHKAIVEACCLALSVAVPLRIGDLHRLVLGEHIERQGGDWQLALTTRKVRHRYERPELWPELCEFLDALLEVDAPGRDGRRGYEARRGTPLFSFDGGATGVHADWISDVWQRHVGIGAHVVRTLWHEVVASGGTDLAWVALALCGQTDRRAVEHYRITHDRRHATGHGRALLAARRRAGRSPRPDPGVDGSSGGQAAK